MPSKRLLWVQNESSSNIARAGGLPPRRKQKADSINTIVLLPAWLLATRDHRPRYRRAGGD
jgi:hypothetical protein